jgi:hypothetical protein
MAHNVARVSLRLHQTREKWEASRDFPWFSDVAYGCVLLCTGSPTPPHFDAHSYYKQESILA